MNAGVLKKCYKVSPRFVIYFVNGVRRKGRGLLLTVSCGGRCRDREEGRWLRRANTWERQVLGSIGRGERPTCHTGLAGPWPTQWALWSKCFPFALSVQQGLGAARQSGHKGLCVQPDPP